MPGRSYKAKRRRPIQAGGAIQNTETLVAIREIKHKINAEKQQLTDTFKANVLNPISFAIQLSNEKAASVEGILYTQTLNKLELLMGLFDSIKIQYNRSVRTIGTSYASVVEYYSKNAATPAYTEFINIFSIDKLKEYKEIQEKLATSVRNIIEKKGILVHELNAYTFFFEHVLTSANAFFQRIDELADEISSYCTNLMSSKQSPELLTTLRALMTPINSTKYIRAVIETDTLYTGISYLQTDVSGALLNEEYAIPILSKLYGDALNTFYTVLSPFTETQLEYLSPDIMPVIHTVELGSIVPRIYKNSILSCSSKELYSPGIVLPRGALKTGDYFIIHNNQAESKSPLIVKIPTTEDYIPYVITPSALTVFFYIEESDFFYGFYSLKDSPLPSDSLYISIDSASQMPIQVTENGTPMYDMYGYMKTLSVPQVEINGRATFDLSGAIMRPSYTGYTRFTPIYSQKDILRSPYALKMDTYVFCNEHGYPILDISGSLIQLPGEPSVQGMYATYTESGQTYTVLILSTTIQTTRPYKIVSTVDIHELQTKADLKAEGDMNGKLCTAFFKDINDLLNDYRQKETIFQNFLSEDQRTRLTKEIASLQTASSDLNEEKTIYDSITKSYPLAKTDDQYRLVNKTTKLQLVKIESMFSSLKPSIDYIENLFYEMKEINLIEQEIKKITDSVAEFVRRGDALRESISKQLDSVGVRNVENTVQDIYVELAMNMKSVTSIHESLPGLKTIDALRDALDKLRILYKTTNNTYTSLESMKSKEIPELITRMKKGNQDFIQVFIGYTIPYLKLAVDISSESIITPDLLNTLKQNKYPLFFWYYVKQFIHHDTQDLYDTIVKDTYTATFTAVNEFLTKYTESYASISIQQEIQDSLLTLYDKINTLKKKSDAFIEAVNIRIADSIKKQYSDISLKIQEMFHYIAGVTLFSDTYSQYIKDDANYQDFIIELRKATDIQETLTQQKNKLDSEYKTTVNLAITPDYTIKPEIVSYISIHQEILVTLTIVQSIFTVLDNLMKQMNKALQSSITSFVTTIKNDITVNIEKYKRGSTSMESLVTALQDPSVQPPINKDTLKALKESYTALNTTLSNTSVLTASPVDIPAILETKQALQTLQITLKNQYATLLVLYNVLMKSATDEKNTQIANLISSHTIGA
jgi:hypothetical protein